MTDVATTYAQLLAAERLDELLGLLGPGCVFQSPFSRWDTTASVTAAYGARAAAFDDLQVHDVLRSTDRAAVLWSASVGGETVEASEVITLEGGHVVRVDVYLRPASVLPAVYAAMTAAWPQR
jgi:hypothetical protein